MLLAACLPLAANDVIFLHGRVEMPGGAQPGKSVEIQLACGGAEPARQTVTDKKGEFNLRVERDDFNHVARALPTTTMDVGGPVGPCVVRPRSRATSRTASTSPASPSPRTSLCLRSC
jgi:hypothetical protein